MVKLEEISRAILGGDALHVRSLVQDWMAQPPSMRDARRPETENAQILAVAASIAELIAARAGDSAPEWTASVAPLSEPLFLLSASRTMPRLRAMCEREAPESLRKRRIFAPSNYLRFV